jgi:DNA-binding GntR family transcriptional regulator
MKTRRNKTAAAQKPKKRGHLQDQVAAQLRQGLMVGVFIPGQVMSLRKLAAAFGTSSMPIRDALSQLVAANVLEETSNRSVRVPRLGNSRLKDLFDLREAVEGLAAKNACRNATPKLIRELQTINRDLKKAIADRDVLAALAANQKFHFALYNAAGSEVFMPLIESLWLQSGPTMYFSFLAPDMPWDASAHTEMIEALRRKDAPATQRAVCRDIRTTARHLLANGASAFPGGPRLMPIRGIELDLAI